MLAKLHSASLLGIEAYPVEIEVDVSSGLPAVNIVGLPDTAVKEARERVKSALKNSGFSFPDNRVTVNLAPADIKKEGAGFDLPIALGILGAMRVIKPETLPQYLFIGELALDGSIRHSRGVLPITLLSRRMGKSIVVPHSNAKEAGIVEGCDVFPVRNLRECVDFLKGERKFSPITVNLEELYSESPSYEVDFSEVRGQDSTKRAVEVAVAGGHNILMIGPPGSGKTMLAVRIPTIMPELSLEESLEVTKIHSIAGLLPPDKPLLTLRPFRAPHHTISDVALIGGGQSPHPGEISLAHHGVLFLDELPEFNRNVLESLRQPLEARKVTVSRASGSFTFPANFLLVGAMNPCPCGNFTHPDKECRCTPREIQRYISRISGPLLDRIDIHIEVPPLRAGEFSGPPSEDSLTIRERIKRAREIQLKRFKGRKIFTNAQMGNRDIEKYCRLKEDGKRLLQSAIDNMGLSGRAYHRILKVSRTIADLEGKETIEDSHVAEAIQYRSLDRSLWW
ncbi:YifB family Mg chelatase-like AAA ATPase [Candidatus Calescamantes bacterium]|nr:YifB family Mg chelatase-like AAA ATPase [Candidatus Calescamantes bacterium]